MEVFPDVSGLPETAAELALDNELDPGSVDLCPTRQQQLALRQKFAGKSWAEKLGNEFQEPPAVVCCFGAALKAALPPVDADKLRAAELRTVDADKLRAAELRTVERPRHRGATRNSAASCGLCGGTLAGAPDVSASFGLCAPCDAARAAARVRARDASLALVSLPDDVLLLLLQHTAAQGRLSHLQAAVLAQVCKSWSSMVAARLWRALCEGEAPAALVRAVRGELCLAELIDDELCADLEKEREPEKQPALIEGFAALHRVPIEAVATQLCASAAGRAALAVPIPARFAAMPEALVVLVDGLKFSEGQERILRLTAQKRQLERQKREQIEQLKEGAGEHGAAVVAAAVDLFCSKLPPEEPNLERAARLAAGIFPGERKDWRLLHRLLSVPVRWRTVRWRKSRRTHAQNRKEKKRQRA